MADGSSRQIKSKSSVDLTVRVGSGINNKLTLNNVLYVPGLGKNLISIPAIQKYPGAKVTFQGDEALVQVSGKIIAVCRKTNHELYILDGTGQEGVVASANSSQRETGKASIHQWHLRMGHMNYGQLKLLPTMAIRRL
jgi:hypothetical protein